MLKSFMVFKEILCRPNLRLQGGKSQMQESQVLRLENPKIAFCPGSKRQN